MIGLNIGWFACVLGAAWNVHWFGLVVVLLLVVIHIFVIGKERILPAALLGLVSLTVGLVLDTTLISVGVYEPNRWLVPPPIATVWLLMLWVNFSLALNESLQWLQEHLFIAAILGSVFGPLAYLAANRLGAVQITTPVSSSLMSVGIAWLMAMPLMSLIAKCFFNRHSRLRNK
ncbi:MAG: DUF2878 domain-containing protein [Candidatus Bathyarchaeota archaeon]|nr:DUF2878 domain-containing protein [Candidatus Bathyarchaeota archaeon]